MSNVHPQLQVGGNFNNLIERCYCKGKVQILTSEDVLRTERITIFTLTVDP